MDEFAKCWADDPDVSGIDVATAERFWRAGYAAATARAAGVAEERFNHHAGFCPATCKCADGAHIAAAIRGEGK